MKTFGKRTGVLSTVAAIALVLGTQTSAQALRDARPPAEFPPASFTGNQYIDSRGCVYVRAGLSGAVNWVPRVSRSREQLCGFQPTQIAGTTRSAPTANVPNPLDTPVAGLAPRAATPAAAPTPAPAAAPTRAATPTRTATPAATRTATPAPAAAAAPVVAAAPTAPVQAARTSLPTSTAGAINPLTGRPVNARPRIATTNPLASPSPRVLSPATTASATSATTPAATSAQRRYSRAEACAAAARQGLQFRSATTGLPLECGTDLRTTTIASTGFGRRQGASPTITNPLDLAPGSTVVPTTLTRSTPVLNRNNPLEAAPGSTNFTSGVNTQLSGSCGAATVEGLPVRCGPQALSPSGRSFALNTTRAQAPLTVERLLGREPAPLSNPAGTVFRVPDVPHGYARVWNDGRLNTQRGLPRGTVVSPTSIQSVSPSRTVTYATQARPQAQPQTTRRATAPASPAPRVEAISGHRYVQVATFANRDQAQAAARALRSRGLPMRVGVFQNNGREMRMVLAGPFGSERQLQSALGTARGAGFGGAFTRR